MIRNAPELGTTWAQTGRAPSGSRRPPRRTLPPPAADFRTTPVPRLPSWRSSLAHAWSPVMMNEISSGAMKFVSSALVRVWGERRDSSSVSRRQSSAAPSSHRIRSSSRQRCPRRRRPVRRSGRAHPESLLQGAGVREERSARGELPPPAVLGDGSSPSASPSTTASSARPRTRCLVLRDVALVPALDHLLPGPLYVRPSEA